MNKHEFINILRQRLITELPESRVQDHILYYSEYIDNEIKFGKTEEEVIASLGDPRLIARTILETREPNNDRQRYENEEHNKKTKRTKNSSVHGKRNVNVSFNSKEINSSFFKVILVLIAIIIITILIGIIVLISKLLGALLSLIAPIILIFIIIAIVTQLFRRK